MITDEQVDAALDYLRTNASKAAKARAHKVYMEEYRKTVKAQQMAMHKNIPITAQEREAYSSPDYIMHLQAIKEAVYEDEFNRWGMVAATSTIDAWRTQNANRRGEGKIG